MAETLERAFFTMDLSQGQIRTGGGDNKPLGPGYYRVRIADCGKNSESSVKFVAEVIEGEFTGSTAWVYLGTDASKVGNLNSWKTTLSSLGFDAASLANTQIDTNEYIGKGAYLRVLPNRDDPTKTDRSFVTADEYTRKTAGGTVGMTVTSVPATTVAAPKAPTLGGKINAPQPGISATKLASFVGR